MSKRIRKYYKETSIKWYAKNREKILACRAKLLELPGARQRKNELHKIRMIFWKNKAMNMLGKICKKCGFSDERALQIDHINSDGRLDRKTCRGTYYKHIVDSINRNEVKYQILCANCNWIKVREKSEYKNVRKYDYKKCESIKENTLFPL